LFENTTVEKVDEGDSCYVVTNKGIVTAQDVIVATNLPILNQGLFFAKTYAARSYIVGAKIDLSNAPVGMYIGSGDSAHSIRTTPYQDKLLLLVGGGGHKVGTVTNTEECYQKLEAYARDRFGIDTFTYRWSNQDMVSFDKLPYIGNLTPFNKHIYVATGFSLWGMSKGTMSGMILSDLILVGLWKNLK
jgi:glycine/D-amino acid oxidase-like deaminating enzyme